RNLPFLGEGDTFTIGNTFHLDVPVEVKLIWAHFPKNLSQSFYSRKLCKRSHFTNTENSLPSRYEIQVRYGPYSWKIIRTQEELCELTRAIRIAWSMIRVKRLKGKFIPGNTTSTRSPRPEIDEESDGINEKIEAYLKTVINHPEIQHLDCVLTFFEISPLTFCTQLGTSKFKEGKIQLLPKGQIPLAGSKSDKFWKRRWLILKDTYLVVLKPHKADMVEGMENWSVEIEESEVEEEEEEESKKRWWKKDKNGSDMTHLWERYHRWRFCKVVLMDHYFQRKIIHVGSHDLLQIHNMQSQLTFIPSRDTVASWDAMVNLVQSSPEARAYTVANPFRSFAPVRNDGQIVVAIDGASYMASVADAMEAARHEIFIADWWLSPEVHLKRPYTNNYWRLDVLLKRKAEQGVRICVLIYNEVKLVLSINSRHSMKTLTSLHCNIHVIRHPSHIRERTWNWSHHEKLVVVDQSVAFVGGIDLCFGRWDRPDHPILDTATHLSEFEVTDLACLPLSAVLLPLRLTTSACLKDEIKNLANPYRLLRTDMPLTPQQSKSTQSLQRKRAQRRFPSVRSAGDPVRVRDTRRRSCNSSTCLGEEENPNRDCYSAFTEPDLLAPQNKQFLFPGKDYANWIFKDPGDMTKPDVVYIDRNEVPRMPWHDVGVGLSGKIVSDFARHFIQRWNAHRAQKVKHKHKHVPTSCTLPILLPTPPANTRLAERLYELGGSFSFGGESARPVRMQALRSAGHWSLVSTRGVKANAVTTASSTSSHTECSILAAYIEAIRSAQHFIYIENQFFISWVNASDGVEKNRLVKNQIAQAIYDRVVKAHREKKPFRVYILIPLLAAFEGVPGDKKSGSNIHAILRFTRTSLFMGPNALISRLRMSISDVENYISVCGLRNYGCWPNGRFTTELVYIHGKLMIVDDRKLIIGSANINDRSMLGNRDSELAVVVEEEVGEGKGGVVADMRRRLMAEHLGVLSDNATFSWDPNLLHQPTSDAFFHGVWRKTALDNMNIFEEVFDCVPSNSARQYPKRPTQLQGKRPRGKETAKLLCRIRGHLCEYPEDYLADEDLTFPLLSVEQFASLELWT
ncbi:Phospholipase D1, partial [Taenia solium]